MKFCLTNPPLNPINKKARAIPIVNPLDRYGRVFFFSWIGFMIAFWSWYAFSPLLSRTIKKDLGLSQAEIANGNILALTATLLVRFFSGPACDKWGPRNVYIALLLSGAIPTACAGGVTNATGLTILRFFVGILGATFVPCQVWSMQFFDKNCVGTSNALIGGWGNAGGGITYFAMPAIYDSLLDNGLTPHVAWRVSFIVPFILITSTGLGMLFFCDDCPTGKWDERFQKLEENIRQAHNAGNVVSSQGGVLHNAADQPHAHDTEKKGQAANDSESDFGVGESEIVDQYNHEIVAKPTFKEALRVLASPQSLVLVACYFNSFGGELAINKIIGAYYLKNFKELNQTTAGQWAAMFGLVNVVFRPMGGLVSDLLYHYTKGNLWAKKMWIHVCGVCTGVFCLAVGYLDPKNLATMVGLILGIAIFMDASNGANYGLVANTHPFANGILSGAVGASGSFGGVIFAVIFRFIGKDYALGIRIIGFCFIATNVLVSWIKPVPKNQIGGR